VIMFLNREGSGQHALKELLVDCRGVPVQGHIIGGEGSLGTGAIVAQVWAVRNEEN
jgi:hypothetical protein